MNRIVLDDCINLLSGTPDDSFDMIFADPPFNISKKYSNYKDAVPKDSYLRWCKQWISECCRTLKPNGTLFVHNIPMWLIDFAVMLNDMVCFKHWIGWNAPTSAKGDMMLPHHYGILTYCKNPDQWKSFKVRHPHKRDRSGKLIANYGGRKNLIHPFGPMVSDIWVDISRVVNKSNRDDHPCQLPPQIIERLILMSTDVGDTVFDPFCGTGTTAVAAKRLGRNYLTCDISQHYIDIANDSISTCMPTLIGDKHVSCNNDGSICTIRDIDWIYMLDYFDIPDDIKMVDVAPIKLKYGINKPIVKSLWN